MKDTSIMRPLFTETKNSVLDKKISRLNRREKKDNLQWINILSIALLPIKLVNETHSIYLKVKMCICRNRSINIIGVGDCLCQQN